jgi:tRNA pseudouridine32 synthase/23S rRNA pseudouridine746 synthase
LGDTLYGGNAADRLYLHAFALHFVWGNETIAVHALPRSGTRFIAPEQQALWLSQYKECCSSWPTL